GNLGLYLPHEMVIRLDAIMDDMNPNPAVAYKLAEQQAQVDAHAGLQAAYKAARIARDAVRDPEHVHDPYGLLWRSHLIAAKCAAHLGHAPAARKSAEEGLKMGGPRE